MSISTNPRPDAWTIPRAMRPFLAVGAAAIVAGGVAAAVTGPTGWRDGSWVAAFLVLVVGVGQIGLGAGQAFLGVAPSAPRRAAQLLVFDTSCALVVAGTLASSPVTVTAGGVGLVGALLSFASTLRATGPARRWPARVYAGLLVVLVVSAPVGLALSWVRA